MPKFMKKESEPKEQTNIAPEAKATDAVSQPLENLGDQKITELESQVAKLTQENNEYLNDLQRTRADFENFRKQTEIQKNQAKDIARLDTVEKFLPLIDDLDRAFDAYGEQLAPLAKSFAKTLDSLQLQKINSEEGIEFNPDFHDAVAMTDVDGDREVVSETLRAGYTYAGSVLRPAMVKVERRK